MHEGRNLSLLLRHFLTWQFGPDMAEPAACGMGSRAFGSAFKYHKCTHIREMESSAQEEYPRS